MSDEKYKQEARSSWQEIASIAESVPESASYIHGFIDGVNRGNKELEHKLEVAKDALESIAKNTCCTPCQEAKKVAKKAIEQLK